MLAEPCTPSTTNQAQLSGLIARLIDIADRIAIEAEAATAVVRGMVDHATRVGSLADMLDEAALDAETDVRRQAETLTSARSALDVNAPVVEGLGRSIEGVASISGIIGGIAKEGRILSLNARIEAARRHDGGGFAVVASEMSALTDRMIVANADIGDRAQVIARDVAAASRIVTAHNALVVEQDDLLALSLEGVGQQRRVAHELVTITTETNGTVDAAAAAIGRVGANAVAMKVLARQLARLTKQEATAHASPVL